MRSAHSREQDFMAITAEIEVLHQQLKGKGMYTVPPALLDDSPRLQSSSSNGPIPCGQTTPQGSVHASNSPTHVPLPHASQFNVPPTPYVNQTAVNQHMGTQPTPIPPKMSTGPTNLQPPAKTPSSQVPSNIQPQ